MRNIPEDYMLFLDGLRESGVTNMYHAAPYLMTEYPGLSRTEAREVILTWMETFNERHPKH